MFEAIGRGEIKALWVMGTNPAVSLPRADAVRAALKKLELSRRLGGQRSCRRHSSTRRASCCCRRRPGAKRTAPSPIPSGASRASARFFGRPARPSRTGGRSPRWRVASVFAQPSTIVKPAEIFREHAALSRLRERRRARFRHRRAAPICLTRPTTRWSRCNGRLPQAARRPAQAPLLRRRLFPCGRHAPASSRSKTRARSRRPSPALPLRLNTGRVRDQWHTMTRTGLSPRLARHREAPFVEVHPDDARRFGLRRRRFCPGDARRTASAMLRVVGQRAPAAAARCSRRFTGATPPPARARVGALVARASSIRFPASPIPRRRRPRSRRARWRPRASSFRGGA